jgi:molybdenum cofactor synthesis domain-containing protein
MDAEVTLLMTGNELLSGDIVDTNSSYMARELAAIGVGVNRKIVIGDNLETITDSLVHLSESKGLVIVNGGLGATVDDLSAEAVSVVTGRPLEENAMAMENIRKRYGKRSGEKEGAYLKHLGKQAYLPKGVGILPNPVGLALGFKVNIGSAVFYFTPGVPREMKTMLRESILPDIKSSFQISSFPTTRKLNVVGVGESRIQQIINENISKDRWEDVELGFRAGMALVEVKLSIQNQSAMPSLERLDRECRSLFSDDIIEPGDSLQEAVVELLYRRRKRLLIVEVGSISQVSALVNSTENASKVLAAGLMLATPGAREKLLESSAGFARDSIQSVDLSEKLMTRFEADYLLSISPLEDAVEKSGNPPGKRLRIVWGAKGGFSSREFAILRDTDMLHTYVGITALDMLRRSLLNLTTDTAYYFDELSRNRLEESDHLQA